MPTVISKPASLQHSLISALEGPEPEKALEQAFLQLAQGSDLSLLMATIKALVRAGLAGLAVRFLQSATEVLSAQPQLAAIAGRLAELPSGEVSINERKKRLDANINAILEGRPHLAAFVEGWRCDDLNFKLYRSAKGNWHALRDVERQRIDFVFPFADHVAHAEGLKLPPLSPGVCFQLVGVPSPALWNRLAQLCDGGYVPPIDLVEPDAEVLRIWLCMIDDCQVLRDEHIVVVCGPDALSQYESMLTSHPWRSAATHSITNIRPRWQPPSIDRQFNDRIAIKIVEQRRDLKAQLDRRHASHDARYWLRRLTLAGRSAPPLRVIGFTSRFSSVMQHSMRDLADAFRRKGCDFQIVMQPNNSCGSVNVPQALNRPQGQEHDLIVVINHLRSEFVEVMPANVPYVCWIQDYMERLWDCSAGESVGEFDLVLGHAPGLMSALYHYPTDRFLATSNLTDPHTYSADPLPERELERVRCDVSFVGHGWQSPAELVSAIADHNKSLLQCLLSFLERAQRMMMHSSSWLTIADRIRLMLQAECESGLALGPALRAKLLYPAIERIYDRLFRHQALEWTAQWATARKRSFAIYGQGWERHALFGRFARGPIKNGRPLRALYQASAISLQINGYQSLHQRLLDGVASGGFVLSRFNPADFHTTHLRMISKAVQQMQIRDITSLLEAATSSPPLQQAIDAAERYSGLCIAPLASAQRRKDVEALREWGVWPDATFDDNGHLESLRTMWPYVHRTAGDIDGFDAATFDTRESLFVMLDRYVDDPMERSKLTKPIRECVLSHDTYDGLVERVLSAFISRFSGACS